MSSPSQAGQLPRLSKYEIVEELGHGGMATVYRARDLRLGREVAIKIIHKHLRESTEVARRFEAEARAVAKLRHPNIVEVYDVSGPEEPEQYIVVELLRGTTLRRILAGQRNMPPEVAAAIGIELGSALAHAHSAGVIHRDLKPENVLIETDGDVRIKLADFGIAKVLDAQGVTSTGQVLGSPAHMAPEQIEGGEVDGRADVFGLGVLLYECMVGHLPFEGSNPAQVLRRVLEGSFAAADRERPLVGARWGRILARALAKDAADRYASADLLVAALRDELSSLKMSDPRVELRTFFADEQAYIGAQPERLFPVLVARAEQARRGGKHHEAAADLNRALAYRPQDPTLLRLIGRLGRRRVFRWVALAAAGSLAAAFAVTAVGLAVKRGVAAKASVVRVVPAAEVAIGVAPSLERGVPGQAAATRAVVAAPAGASAPASSGAALTGSPSSSASLGAPGSSAAGRPKHVVAPGPPALPALRDVSFEVLPKGALVSIDGEEPEQLFTKVKKLTVGVHTFEAHVKDSKCCEPLHRVEEIKADDGSLVPQQVSLSLEYRDAAVWAPAAPPGAELRCPMLDVAGPAGQKFSIHMLRLVEQDIACNLRVPGGRSQLSSVTVRAGELAEVPWSAAK
jgi:eukaryotic-like serine/threonine-protein kinase